MNIGKEGGKKGIVLTLLGASLWGFSGACGQFLFDYKGMVSSWLVPYRLICAGLILLVFLLIRDRGKVFDIWKNKNDVITLLIFGLFGMAGCQYTYFFAIQNSNAGTGTVLQSLSTVMIMTVTCIMARRRPSLKEIIAVVFAFTGTFLLATNGDITKMQLSPVALVSGLLSAAFVVIYSMQPKKIIAKYGTLTVAGWGMLIGGILLFAVFRPFTVSVVIDGEALLALGGIFILGTVCAFSLFLEGIKHIGSKKAALLGTTEPVVASLLSVCVFHSAFTIADFVAIILILSTIFLCVKDDN